VVHPILDNRIHYKECISLKNEGYDVAIAAPIITEEQHDNIKYLPLGTFSGRLNRLMSGWRRALKVIGEFKPDVIHIHDPELVGLSFLLRKKQIKLIYDVHEDLPKQLLYKSWIPLVIRWPLSRIVRAFESFSSKYFHGILTVTNEIANRFEPSKTDVLRNLPLLSLKKDRKTEGHKNLRLIYAGGLTRLRGIRELIQAVSLSNQPVNLVLVGKWESDEFRKQCESENGFENCKYLGYMNMDEVYQEIANSDVGIATLYPIRNYLESLPVKAFEYMLHGLPVIMSDFDYWKSQFRGAALFVDSMNPGEIAKTIDNLIENQNLRHELSERALALTKNELNWERESQKLLEMYHKILEP